MYTSVLAALACAALVSAKTCTYTANFDDKKASYKPVPDGYINLKWSSDAIIGETPYVVVADGAPEVKYKGGSDPNALLLSSSPFSISSVNDKNPSKEFLFSIKSFDIACTKAVPHEVTPVGCSFLISNSDEYGNYINTTKYDVPLTNPSKPTYIRLAGPKAQANVFRFEIIGKPLGTYDLDAYSSLQIDNIVTEQPCKK